jgi:uncharacterized protein with von Willebrand factor type A (vWA) domain
MHSNYLIATVSALLTLHACCLFCRFNKRLAALEHEVIGSPDAIQSHHAAYTAAQTQSPQQQQQQQQHTSPNHNIGTSSLTQARSRIDNLEQLAGAAALAKSHEARLKAIEQQLKTQADQWDMDKAQVVLDTWLQRPQSSQQKQQQQQQSQHTASTTLSFKPANAARLSTRECAAVTLQAWIRHTLKSREKQQANATERATEGAEENSSNSSLPTPPAVTERSIAGALHVSTRVHAEGSVLEPVRLTSTTTNSTTNSSHDAVVPALVRSSSAVGTPALLLTGE